jgi:hypothetical protein
LLRIHNNFVHTSAKRIRVIFAPVRSLFSPLHNISEHSDPGRLPSRTRSKLYIAWCVRKSKRNMLYYKRCDVLSFMVRTGKKEIEEPPQPHPALASSDIAWSHAVSTSRTVCSISTNLCIQDTVIFYLLRPYLRPSSHSPRKGPNQKGASNCAPSPASR